MNAIKHVEVDHILPLEQVGATIVKLASQEHHVMEKEEPVERSSVGLTCPQCRGPLTQERQGKIIEYRCRVGHVYSPLVMAAAHEETVERALWAWWRWKRLPISTSTSRRNQGTRRRKLPESSAGMRKSSSKC